MSTHHGLSIKRLTKEFNDLKKKPSYMYYAEPVKGEMFEWHFTIRGPPGTDYEGGIYHGIILFPESYPFKPPSVQFLTPNGRFETNTKICLTFTNFHPEFWQPAWTIRTILIGLISYLPVEEENLSIGAIITTPEERRRLAKASQFWECKTFGLIREHIKDKMKEEFKVNDEAAPKDELPEFKITKKVSKNPAEEIKISKDEPIDRDPFIDDEYKSQLEEKKEIPQVEEVQEEVKNEPEQVQEPELEQEPVFEEENIEAPVYTCKSKLLPLVDADKQEFKDYIESQRESATNKAFKF